VSILHLACFRVMHDVALFIHNTISKPLCCNEIYNLVLMFYVYVFFLQSISDHCCN
jgi:hypothetical protein